MKKKISIFVLFCFAACLGFGQSFLPKGTYRPPFEKGGAVPEKAGTPKNKSYYLQPVLGYANFYSPGERKTGSGNIVMTGLDFTYITRSGFAVYFNNSFNFGTGRFVRDEFYYSGFLKKNEPEIFTGSISGWSMELLLGYSKRIGKHNIGFGLGYQTSVNFGRVPIIEFGAFAIRADYAYFLTDKIGISAALTEGLGGGIAGGDIGFINYFAFKAGPCFKL